MEGIRVKTVSEQRETEILFMAFEFLLVSCLLLQ